MLVLSAVDHDICVEDLSVLQLGASLRHIRFGCNSAFESVFGNELDRARCLDLLERVAASTELRRAARLRDFLRYVGRRWSEEDHGQISEQEIGEHVFGRPSSYDTSHDNIVRVNASELRKRIEMYFAAEGAHEPLILEIPRGSYTPVFHPRAEAAGRPSESAVHLPDPNRHEVTEIGSAPVPAPETLPLPPSISRNWLMMICALAIIALSITSIDLFRQKRELQQSLYPWKNQATLASFWSNFISADRQTDIVLADTSFAMVEDTLRNQINLTDYLNHGYQQQIEASSLSPELKATLRIIATRNNGSFGDFEVAQKILNLDPLSTRLHLQFSREYMPAELRSDNVVLIGSSRSNPWVGLFEGNLNFTLALDPALNGTLVVKNRKPLPGESSAYASFEDASVSTGYAVVDYIPNQTHTTDVLIIAGTTSTATQAAGDFLTSQRSLEQLQRRMHVNKLPYFEVLLRTTRLIGTPLSSEIIACRAYSSH